MAVAATTSMATGVRLAMALRPTRAAVVAMSARPGRLKLAPDLMPGIPLSTVTIIRRAGVAALRPSMVSGRRAAVLTSLTFRLGAPSMSVMGGRANCATDLLILTLPSMRIGRRLIILFRSRGAGRMIRRIFAWHMLAAMRDAATALTILRGCRDGWEETASSCADCFAWR